MRFMPENIATFGSEIDSLTLLITLLGGVSLLVAELILFYSAFKFHRNRKAAYILGNTWKQARWVLIPVIVVIVMDFYIDIRTTSAWESIKGAVPPADQVVRITGQQYSWVFTHGGPDKMLGTDDDIQTVNELHILQDANIVFDLEARDVLHSFWVPSLRLKQDAVPGRTIRGWFNATRAGEFEIACAEICGTGHTAMRATLIVHSSNDYEEWLKDPSAFRAKLVSGDQSDFPSSWVPLRDKGCLACHSTDGSQKVGPSYKGLFGSKRVVLTDNEEREIVADEEYLKRSILTPRADLVKGFPPVMPPLPGAPNEREIDQLIQAIKDIQ